MIETQHLGKRADAGPVSPGSSRDGTEGSAMKNSQRAGSQDDRAGTGWVRRWWTGDKLSVRLFEVAFVLVLTGALAWMEWFACR